MNITLPADLEKFIEEQIDNGNFSSASEMIKEALMLMQKHRKVTASNDFNCYRENLNRELEKGLDDIKHGRTSDSEEVFQRLRSKLDAWGKEKS